MVPNVVTDRTYIMLGSINVITDGTFITLGSSYYTCAFYTSPILGICHFFWPGSSYKNPMVWLKKVCKCPTHLKSIFQ